MPVSQKNPRCLAPLRGRLRRGPPGAVPAGGWENTGLGHFKDTRLGWDILKTRLRQGGPAGHAIAFETRHNLSQRQKGVGKQGVGAF